MLRCEYCGARVKRDSVCEYCGADYTEQVRKGADCWDGGGYYKGNYVNITPENENFFISSQYFLPSCRTVDWEAERRAERRRDAYGTLRHG